MKSATGVTSREYLNSNVGYLVKYFPIQNKEVNKWKPITDLKLIQNTTVRPLISIYPLAVTLGHVGEIRFESFVCSIFVCYLLWNVFLSFVLRKTVFVLLLSD